MPRPYSVPWSHMKTRDHPPDATTPSSSPPFPPFLDRSPLCASNPVIAEEAEAPQWQRCPPSQSWKTSVFGNTHRPTEPRETFFQIIRKPLVVFHPRDARASGKFGASGRFRFTPVIFLALACEERAQLAAFFLPRSSCGIFFCSNASAPPPCR